MIDSAASRIERARDERATRLDLSNLGLRALPELVAPLPWLTDLDLGRNRLDRVADWVWRLPDLERLDLGQNRLRELDPGIGQLTRLRTLDLSENRLERLPDALAACASLRWLDLYGNALRAVPEVLKHLPWLHHVDLAGNRIEGGLDLSGAYTQLEWLDLSHNGIVGLMPDRGRHESLRLLDLSANRLVRIGEGELPDTLRSLRLDDNALDYVTPRLLEALQPGSVSVDGNPVAPALYGYASVERHAASAAALDALVRGGARDGVRHFDAPARIFDFELDLGAADVGAVLDGYYKSFKGAPVSLRLGDATHIDLAAMSRKAARDEAGRRVGDVSLQFTPVAAAAEVERVVRFATRTLDRNDGVRLIREPGRAGGGIHVSAGSAGAAGAVEAVQTVPPERGVTEPPPPRVFHFVLEGKYARGAAMVVRSTATLAFRHALAPANALGVVDHPALDAARESDLDITLLLSVRGRLEIVGPRSATARFAGGALQGAVEFKLEAGESPGADNAVHIDFSVAGRTVHQVEFAVAVVADAAGLTAAPVPATAVPPSLLADAATVAPAAAERIELALSFDRQRFRIDLCHRRGGVEVRRKAYIAKDLDRTRLEVAIATVRAELAPCYVDADFWNGFDGAVGDGGPGKAQQRALLVTMKAAACAGWQLATLLNDQPRLAEALAYIDAQRAPDLVLTVRTDDIFLPWELMYPRLRTANMSATQDAGSPLDASLFWGVRFAIETVQLRGTTAPAAGLREQLAAPARLIAHVDPAISATAAQVQREWIERLGGRGVAASLSTSCAGARSALQDGVGAPTLIYVYCHGQSPSAFGGLGEKVDLLAECPLKPPDLQGGIAYPRAPIVFFNSCGSGAYSSLTFSSFLARFRARGALGMIATTYSVPVEFAARFAEGVVDCVLARRGSLAVALLALRRRHLAQGNPVPLFYTLQCQLDFPEAP